MSLVSRLDQWREDVTRDDILDGAPPTTEEKVLAQFLYSALVDCFESDTVMGAFMDGVDGSWSESTDRAFDKTLNTWVDEYAAAHAVAAASEPPQLPEPH